MLTLLLGWQCRNTIQMHNHESWKQFHKGFMKLWRFFFDSSYDSYVELMPNDDLIWLAFVKHLQYNLFLEIWCCRCPGAKLPPGHLQPPWRPVLVYQHECSNANMLKITDITLTVAWKMRFAKTTADDAKLFTFCKTMQNSIKTPSQF